MAADFFDEYDGRIVVTSNRQRGIWSNVVVFRDTRTTKNAGIIPYATATHDTLLAIALTSALSGISTHKTKSIVQQTGRSKPKIQVRTSSKSFADLMTAALAKKKDPRRNGFRCAGHFVLPLFKQLVRFDLEFVVENVDESASLRSWSSAALRSYQAIFAPTTSQQLVGSRL